MSDGVQLEFDFMRELREKEVWERLSKRHLVRYEHPRDDNQRLLNFQYEWLEHGDERAWAQLWILAQKVARRMVQKAGARTGFRFTREDMEDRVMVAVEYVLRRYQAGWYVQRAYLKAIKEGVVHAMWYRTKADDDQESQSLEQMALHKVYDKDPFDDERAMVMINGMTREQAEARIRREFLPELADWLLAKLDIVGGVKHEKKGNNQGDADQGAGQRAEQG